MPTILRIGKYRFFFYSNEFGEPPHIHVQCDDQLAKFWIEPIALAHSVRVSAQDLRKIEVIVIENQSKFMEAWNEFFGTK